MGPHQQSDYDLMQVAQPVVTGSRNGASQRPSMAEDEIPAELDEPPDELIHFTRLSPLKSSSNTKRHPIVSSTMPHPRKASLLTQALLTSDDSTPNSDAEPPLLTSDADLTSPARTNSPSPSLPASRGKDLGTIPSQDIVASDPNAHLKHVKFPLAAEATDSSGATDLEAGLGRKRCIRFACGRQAPPQPDRSQGGKPPVLPEPDVTATKPSKRPCLLKFVCPTKATSRSSENRQMPISTLNNDQTERAPSTVSHPSSRSSSPGGQHRDSVSTIKNVPVTEQLNNPGGKTPSQPLALDNLDLEGSEATRFHEFAGPYSGEDEWIHEQTAYRKKITVNDTLQKENAIRQLGEEAEAEALEEEDAEEEESYAELDENNDDGSSDDALSDAGNETDDEEGFADSDDESELGSEYQFWTPGLTTAATSADHLEHIRPHAPRMASNSSIESMVRVKDTGTMAEPTGRRARRVHRTQPLKMRPGTPDLPDSTDFVCGTLDEDRPLEAAFMSCLEERKRSKHRVMPQDIDPSFPASDPEDDSDDELNSVSMQASEEPLWVMGQPDNSDEDHVQPRHKGLTRRNTKSPMPSPKRLRSPRPPRRGVVHRSPHPRAAARPNTIDGDSLLSLSASGEDVRPTRRTPSPPSAMDTKAQELVIHHLPRRPRLTHTASLPRTPNPFWAPREAGFRLSPGAASPTRRAADMRSRGPIDIVTGLKKRRQRRKEKFWRQHSRNAGKEKERRCQPGKGAERMRELGLEMAGKNKGYLPNALMLSI
ncbi:MAG: hypothetical protein L6R40_001295 [Gallowayella cf. fulva]|nr:MAG: hypothetical protein L6R40_001295 [Xanthomendoza cf. fulva]